MGIDSASLREQEIFRALSSLSGCDFSIIGGYAVNAYVLPRFSVDCDLVASGAEGKKISAILVKRGYVKAANAHEAYHNFERFEREVAPGFFSSFDLLIDSVHDRQSGATFSADWVIGNSSLQTLAGKTVPERRTLRILSADALFVMKFACARVSDIRDLFMLCTEVKDWEFARREIGVRIGFGKQHAKIMEKVRSRQFKNNLEGVFGYVEPHAFAKRLAAMESLGEKGK